MVAFILIIKGNRKLLLIIKNKDYELVDELKIQFSKNHNLKIFIKSVFEFSQSNTLLIFGLKN